MRIDWFRFIIWFIAILAISGVIVSPIAMNNSKETLRITITDKDRVQHDDGDKYLVWADTENGSEVFENTDYGSKFNSSDFQGKLKIGESYTVKVIGWRRPSNSMYRNIIKIGE